VKSSLFLLISVLKVQQNQVAGIGAGKSLEPPGQRFFVGGVADLDCIFGWVQQKINH
jgi:hypothetical protein